MHGVLTEWLDILPLALLIQPDRVSVRGTVFPPDSRHIEYDHESALRHDYGVLGTGGSSYTQGCVGRTLEEWQTDMIKWL
jgi:hypothetical protein